MKTKLLLCAVTLCLPALSAAQIVEEIVARVNDQIITRSEFARSKDQLRDEAKQQDPADPDKIYNEREKDVLRDLIDQQLLLEKGKDDGITGDTELIKQLDQMRKEMKLDSMEALEKAATAQGISYEDFKQIQKNQIITKKVIGEEVGSHLAISKEEEQAFYEEHKSEMEQPEAITLSEILVAPIKPAADKPATDKPAADKPATDKPATDKLAADKPEADKKDEKIPQAVADTPPAGSAPAPDPAADAAKQAAETAAWAAAEAKADDLLKQIRAGATFEDVAKKSSDGPTAADGGSLGVFKRGVLAKELEDKTFAMKAGEVSDVTRTKQGFIILKVTDHRAPGIPPFKDVEPHLQDALYYQKLQPALREFLKRLREEAYIKIEPGYTDSGASPNQTQPVETATSKEAEAKNLKAKRKKKLGIL